MKVRSRVQQDKVGEAERAGSGEALEGDFDPPSKDRDTPAGRQYEPSTGNE